MTTPVAGKTSQPGDHDGRPAGDTDASGAFVAYDQFIDDQLHTARRQVRTVDIAVSLTTLGAGTLGFFLLAVLCDHWLLPGGLGTVGRWLALAIYLAGALAYSWRSLLPLCIRRINPVYAAFTIERSKPTLKNSLINFLLLRATPAGLAPQVYEAIEQRAATELAQVPVESTIDRSKLIKIGYVFLGLLLVAAIYKVSSPKDPFQTFGRIVLPWADLAPPTRVSIVEVRPGNSTVMRGQRAKISAQVHGITGQQAVRLVYSTDDGQIVDRAVPMQIPTEGYLFECDLPEGKGGIQQDINYRIVAGDATSNEFRLTVQAAPTIVIESVDYVYPGYTGMVSQTVDHQGDLKAIEGTQVTLHALANQPIKAAAIDFDCNGSEDQRMTFDGRHATATMTLELKADRQTPEHTSYQLRFTNADGKENPQPIRHQIEVARDVSPEIEFLAPKRDEIEVPLNGTLRCEVSAHDPDFALARVALVGQWAAGKPFERPLLEDPSKSGQPWQGQFHKKLSLVPQKLGLKVGDVLEYWAFAEDNKTPLANRTETVHRRARIISPVKSEVSPDAVARGDEESADKDQSPGDKQAGKKPASPDGDVENSEADAPAEPSKPGADPARQPNPKRDGDQPPNSDPQNQQQPNKADSMQDRPSDNPDRKPADRDQTDQAQGKQGQEGEENSQNEAGQEQSGGEEQSGKGQSGKGQSGKGKSGKSQSGKDSTGQEGSEQGESTDPSSGDSAQQGEGQGGKPGAQNKQGSNRSGGGKRQPVAKDGTQDGEAFDEIMDRQSEQEQGDSATGARQTTTRSSSTPPAHGTASEKTRDQGPSPEQTGEQKASKQESGNKPAGDQPAGAKPPGAKESADKNSPATGDSQKKGADKQDGDKERASEAAGDKKPADGSGTGAGEKPPGNGEKQPQDSSQGKKDPAGSSDGKMPSTDGQSENGDGGADGKPMPDGKQKPDGKQTAGKKSTDGKAAPDGKDMKHAGDGEEKKPSDDGQSNSPPSSGQSKSGQPGSEKQPPDQQAANKQSSNGQTEKPSAAGQSPNGEKPDKDQLAGENKSGAGTESPKDEQSGDPKAEQGAQPHGKSGQPSTQKPNDQPKGKAGDGQENQGKPGDGQKSADDPSASPKSEGENRPSKQSPGNGKKADGSPEKPGTTPSPSASGRPSDSKGEESGDRQGGGKKGDGQKSKQAGPGGQGSHSAADDGGEGTPDPAGQESSDQPGSDREAEKPTGQNGKTAGPGSKSGSPPGTRSKPADGKNQATDKPAEGKGADKPGEGQTGGKPAADGGQGQSPSGNRGKAGPGQGGGNAGDNQPVEPPPAAAEQADEANLDFARKATELTVQRLRDQLAKGQVDQDLLDRLQWSQQDMERWVSRWEEMFRRSEQRGKEGQAARKELDATLRSLGLRPHGAEVSGHRPDDTARGMKEGRRTQPPAEYRDQVRQYLQGVSRTQNGATTGRGAQPSRQTAPAGAGSEK
jgi:hypothetical protein